MSSIDLSNPKVLKNYIKSQVNEERGDFEYRDDVLIFVDNDGNQFVAPEDIKDEIKIKAKIKRSTPAKDAEEAKAKAEEAKAKAEKAKAEAEEAEKEAEKKEAEEAEKEEAEEKAKAEAKK